LLPKDNENVPITFSTTDGPSEAQSFQSFTRDQMVRCEECLRANPPTRVNCLYCAAVLPLNETTINLQKPALRPLEKWERGYNSILLPRPANHLPLNLSEADLTEAADALRLTIADLFRILSLGMPLPLARAATSDEAALVQRRLSSLAIETLTVPDAALGLEETGPTRVRAIDISEDGVNTYQTPESPPKQFRWDELELVVVGRLLVKRIELKEEKSARAENRILDASEFFSDESVLDLYMNRPTTPYRIAANSFDFSCLGHRKSLLAAENISTLLNLFRERAAHAEVDETYNSARKALDAVWPAEQLNESAGWRRERPGKYSIGSVTEVSNESQFLRYSRLRYFLRSQAKTGTDEAS
ncbi:MAG TPA: hypothetical protein DHU55_08770, partial [Blastocatellia bacterium]|nr:hypothetical protein [Blastocatellia bacterium]HCX29842.1 hypothetical protein [Blastocatellia bacterium]